MSLWNDSPRLTSPPQTNDVAVILDYVKGLANTVAKMAKDLEFILNGNVAFDNIRAEGIEAKNIKAEAITTDKLQAGAVIAEKIDVNELSAISANLGHILAGLIEAVEIYGSYISTNRIGYPRAEMSNIDNLFSASQSAVSNVKIEAVGRQASSPEVSVNSGQGSMTLFQQGGQSGILASGPAGLTLFGVDINLSPLSFGRVNVPFSQLFDTETNTSLRDQLDG